MTFSLKATDKTPAVKFLTEEGLLTVKGISIPEDSRDFYRGLNLEVEDYLKSPQSETHIEFHLEYFNTSTTIMLRDLIKKFQEAHREGKSDIHMLWVYEEDDLDMEDAGAEFRNLFHDITFELQSVEEFDFR